jgi:hypothetical protein
MGGRASSGCCWPGWAWPFRRRWEHREPLNISPGPLHSMRVNWPVGRSGYDPAVGPRPAAFLGRPPG